MAYPKEYSVVLFVLLLAVMLYLFLLQRMTAANLLFSIPAIGLAVALLHNLDNATRLIFKGGGLEGAVELQQIRNEVYAKANEVQNLGQDVAEMIAWSIAGMNRWVGDDHEADLISRRERLRKTLTELRTPEDRQREILSPITAAVTRDLSSEIVHIATTTLARQGRSDVAERVQEQLRQVFGQSDVEKAIQDVRTILTTEKVDDPAIDQAIQRYVTFVREDRLLPFEKKAANE